MHGITANHAAWPFLAEALPDRTLVAPDLRGRAGSRHLPGPSSMAQHADDVAVVIRAVSPDAPVDVVGHSMGGFVAVVLAHRHPELVARLVLVDGGLPFAPAELESTTAGLELIKVRLAATLGEPTAYVDLFRHHPAFARDWTPEAEAYATYDVVERAPGQWGSSADIDRVVEDQLDIGSSEALQEAWAALPECVFLHADKGFVDDPPGLYAADTVEDLAREYPQVSTVFVDDVNHYTIVMSARGASAIASTLAG